LLWQVKWTREENLPRIHHNKLAHQEKVLQS